MALKVHRITINLEVKGQREPELYAGLKAIPEVCRDAVLRGLLTLAIKTPPHLVAASARHAGEIFANTRIEEGATITRKLTFQSDRPEDHHLHAHFAAVPVGRRLQTVRSLLMMGLLTQHAPQAQLASDGGDVADVAASQIRQSEVFTEPSTLDDQRPASVPVPAPATKVAAPISLPGSTPDDLEELFDAIPMKV